MQANKSCNLINFLTGIKVYEYYWNGCEYYFNDAVLAGLSASF